MRGPVIHEDGKVWCQFDDGRSAMEAALLLHEFHVGRVTVTPRTVDEFGKCTEWRVEVPR